MRRPTQFISLPAQIMDIMRGLHPTVVSSFRVNMFFLRKHVYKVYYTKKNMFTKSTTQRKTCLQSLLHKENMFTKKKKVAKAYFYNKSLKKVASYS